MSADLERLAPARTKSKASVFRKSGLQILANAGAQKTNFHEGLNRCASTETARRTLHDS